MRTTFAEGYYSKMNCKLINKHINISKIGLLISILLIIFMVYMLNSTDPF